MMAGSDKLIFKPTVLFSYVIDHVNSFFLIFHIKIKMLTFENCGFANFQFSTKSKCNPIILTEALFHKHVILSF